MNCFNHSETLATGYCRTCGKALCNECRRTAQGVIFCDEHVPAAAAQAPPPQAAYVQPDALSAALTDVSPGLALLLGFIPGVGAIYNGQYAKGLVHAVIIGLLVSIQSSGNAGGLEPLFGILTAVWIFYMALEAYHTARKRKAGEVVDEFSSLINMRGQASGFPAGAITLIALGVILLLNTMGVLEFRYLIRYWPVGLILVGAYMLYGRVTSAEVGNERH